MPASLKPVVPASPAIPGLTFRHLASASDHVGMLAVRLGSVVHDRIDLRSAREALPSENDLRATFPADTMHNHPDLLLVDFGGQVIGYNHVLWRWTEVTGVRVYLHLGYLLPAWRNQGIGSAMLRWAQQRIRTIAASEQADARATFATNVSSTEVEADVLIQCAGYTAVRRLSDMVTTVVPLMQESPLPPGVEVQPVEPAQHRAIYEAIKEANSELWTSTAASEADYADYLAENVDSSAYDPTLWHVAWAGETAVGVVIGRVDQKHATGQVAEVAVRPAWQRRGIARALLQQALQSLGERGMTHVRLYTDANNGQGARSLYESAGFRELKQHILYRKPLSGPEAF